MLQGESYLLSKDLCAKFCLGKIHISEVTICNMIQSSKYLLKAHHVLGTGSTKLNKMQWVSQFSGETDVV